MADPHLSYWHAAKKILQYLNKTMTFGLEYSPNIEYHKASYSRSGLVDYANSNHAGDTKSRQSTMGYIYCLNGVIVFWSSKRAKTITVSSTEAEYIVLSNASKEAIQMKRFINNFQALDCIDTLPMLSNNTSSIKMIKNDKFPGQTKYIDIQHHFIRKLVEQNKICIDYINIKDMLANNFTKALGQLKFENHQA